MRRQPINSFPIYFLVFSAFIACPHQTVTAQDLEDLFDNPKSKPASKTKQAHSKARFKRPGIVVLPFRFAKEEFGEATPGTFVWTLGDGVEVKTFTPELTRTLVEQKFFNVIEHSKLNLILEKRKANKKSVDFSKTKLSKALGVDYIVYGVITNWAVYSSVEAVPFSSRFRTSYGVAITVEVRVFDTHTGAVVFADSVSERRIWSSLQKDKTPAAPTSDDYYRARLPMVKTLGTMLYDFADPCQIVTKRAESSYINRGSAHGVKVGALYNLVRQGKVIRDDRSGEILDRETKVVGQLQVVKVFRKSAAVKVIKGQGRFGDRLVRVIVRAVKKAPRQRKPADW
jgi:curli biogenesis system outer membrane secretion channel CsgG